jgi:mycothiol synthase
MTQSMKNQSGPALPEGFTVRGARFEDIEPALEMYNLWSRVVIGEDEITDPEILRNEWISPGFDPLRDIRVVFGPDGTLAGYIEVWTTAKPPVHPWIWGRVHPQYESMGIGTFLLNWAEERASQVLDEVPSELRIAPRLGTYRQSESAKQFFEANGYAYIRSNYRMLIEMDAPPQEPVWPQGITLRMYSPETDAEAVYRAEVESFRDHFGFVEEPFDEGFERFMHAMTEHEAFEPSLWFLAVDGDQIAGMSLCRPYAFDASDRGHVNILAVRRPWRKRGIGLALLQHSFAEFYRRGKRAVSLGVDAENLTGALRLYVRAGMHVHLAFDTYEKEIRPGQEISVQSLQE